MTEIKFTAQQSNSAGARFSRNPRAIERYRMGSPVRVLNKVKEQIKRISSMVR